MKIVDEYEPIEEGLDEVTIERFLQVLEITLTTKGPEGKTLKNPPSPNSFIQGPNKDLIKDTSEIGCFELFFNKAIL